MDTTTVATLRARHRAVREKQSTALATRLHRAISWLQRAEAGNTDDDTRFIHLWIALNAAYASEFDFEDSDATAPCAFLPAWSKPMHAANCMPCCSASSPARSAP